MPSKLFVFWACCWAHAGGKNEGEQEERQQKVTSIPNRRTCMNNKKYTYILEKWFYLHSFL